MDLAARAQLGREALQQCRLCPRDCGVDRSHGRQGAFCRLDARAWVYKELLSLGEEAAIGPTMLVDLGGCSLRCLFCSEWQNVAHPQQYGAVELDGAWLAARMAKRKAQGAKTVSFVGGDPTPSLPAVLHALTQCREHLPIVWNCNGLIGDPAAALLNGLVATWIIDLKFGNPQCAERLAGVRSLDYAQQIERSFQLAQQTRPVGDLPVLVVRHLLMPGHEMCCTAPVLQGLAARLPAPAQVNLMTGYVPPQQTMNVRKHKELQDWNNAADIARTVDLARSLLGARLLVDGAPPPPVC